MKLTYNDIRYIISETTKRIVTEGYGSNKKSADFYIDIADIMIDPIFDDELDMCDEDVIHVVCTFNYHDGQRGSWDTDEISPSYTLNDVIPEDNEELENSISPEAYNALMDAVVKHVWGDKDYYEMKMNDEDEEYNTYLRDWYYDSKSDEERMNRLDF